MFVFTITLAFVIIAVGLAWFLLAEDRGEKEPILALWMAFGLGFIGCLVAGAIEYALALNSASSLASHATGSLFTAAVVVGVIEELCKFLPLALFIYRKPYFNEHTDGIVYFALAGLGFGLPENIMYTLQFGSSVGLKRLLLTPFFHAAITTMIGFFLIRVKLRGQSLWRMVPVLAAAILTHALYDFGLLTGKTALVILAVAITLLSTLLLFVLFDEAIEEDQRLGLSPVGHNRFCRSCGEANKSHHLYCIYCGQRA